MTAPTPKRRALESAICPDCEGRTVIVMVGEEWPCPSCQQSAYAEQLQERGINDGQFGAGA